MEQLQSASFRVSTPQLNWHPKGAALPSTVHAKIKHALCLMFSFMMPPVWHKAHYKINSFLQYLFSV